MFEIGLTGAVGRVSRSRLSTSSRPLLPLHYSVVGYRVSVFEHGLGESTVLGGGWVSHLFRRSKSSSVDARELLSKVALGVVVVFVSFPLA